ncbi:hypothetical protein [Georgenia ruanii]|uniref:hypothetical protein n=1 Tax=Georgenia ruanii TaxID=348442 RepID=UPI0012659C73|nr:hypothetical protein [Georgenia ruanii]
MRAQRDGAGSFRAGHDGARSAQVGPDGALRASAYRAGQRASARGGAWAARAALRPGTSAVAGRAVLPPTSATPQLLRRLLAGPGASALAAAPGRGHADARLAGPPAAKGLPRTLAALQALDGSGAGGVGAPAGDLTPSGLSHPRQEGPTMSVRHPAVPSAGLAAPATALAFRRRELDVPGQLGLDLDEIVDLVVERVEERVVAELERRGRRGGMGVF